jgi:hypothetical protein
MKTAVEWQYIELSKFINGKSEFTDANDILIKAKEMEKEQKGYSEEEVLVLLHKRDNHNIDDTKTFNGWLTPKEWFEQLKQQEQ